MIAIKKEPDHDEHRKQTPELGDQKKPADEKLKMLVNIGLPSA
jgi:hypothetical protein